MSASLRRVTTLSLCFFLLSTSALVVVEEGTVHPHLPGLFGPEFPPSLGPLPLSLPKPASPTGCASDAYLGLGTNGTVALVKRGSCRFVDKVFAAQSNGALAVLVFDDDFSETGLVLMSAVHAASVSIPSAFVNYQTGLQLNASNRFRAASSLPPLHVVINATGALDQGQAAPPRLGAAMRFLFIVFCLVWAAIAMAMGASLVKKRCAKRRRLLVVRTLPMLRFRKSPGAQAEDEESGVCADPNDVRVALTEGLSKSCSGDGSKASAAAVQDEPSSEFVGDNFNEACVVCLCDFAEGEKVTVLPCKHAYHKQCIEPWLIKKSACCPICKQSILPSGDSRAIADIEAAGQEPRDVTLGLRIRFALLDFFSSEDGGRGANQRRGAWMVFFTMIVFAISVVLLIYISQMDASGG